MSTQPVSWDESLTAECQKSPDFWFETGNFVLVASQKVAYRLQGDVLGRKSKVFSDLLNLNEVPRPDSESVVDGCPIVHITDSPDDFNTFLSLLYDGFEHHERHVLEPRWATVRVMVLLGDKYDVPTLRADGLRRLRAWYSEDIKAWDKRDEKFFARETDHLSVASVTRTLDDLKFHLAVLYHCCRLPPSLLVAGDPATGCPPLCAEDLVRTFSFSRAMTLFWHGFALGLTAEVDLFCKVLQCLHCHVETIRPILKRFFGAIPSGNIYKFLDFDMWHPLTLSVKPHLCENCMASYTTRLLTLRQNYRSRLGICLQYR